MNAAQRRSIALDYWFNIGVAVLILAQGSMLHNWGEPGMFSLFGATCFVIRAHGLRNRQTMIALHEGGTK